MSSPRYGVNYPGQNEPSVESALYWNGYREYKPGDDYWLSFGHYGVVNIGGKNYIYDATKANPDVLDKLAPKKKSGGSGNYDLGVIANIVPKSLYQSMSEKGTQGQTKGASKDAQTEAPSGGELSSGSQQPIIPSNTSLSDLSPMMPGNLGKPSDLVPAADKNRQLDFFRRIAMLAQLFPIPGGY
jgi:hypothetical protein